MGQVMSALYFLMILSFTNGVPFSVFSIFLFLSLLYSFPYLSHFRDVFSALFPVNSVLD